MRSPVDTVKGRIVDYDPRTQEVTIKARYTDWDLMVKREYKECLIQMIDGRQLSNKQRKACYAILRAISDFSGMAMDRTKELMKIKFLVDELQETADKIFSLSNAPMSLVCAFQRYLIRFVVDWEVPCKFPLLNYIDDFGDFLYACLIKKRCFICGQKADLHHVDHVGMGFDRDEIIHEGMEVLPCCRGHHAIAHTIGERAFLEKYHIDKGIILDKQLCKIYGLKAQKEEEDA